MNAIKTLNKESLNKIKESKRIKIDFESNASENVNKLIERSNPNFDLTIQVLPAKEIESYLQKRFSLLEIKVSELESETTKRLISAFAPKRYTEQPDNDETKSFLDDLLDNDDIVVSDEEKVSWASKKIKVSLKRDSEFYTKEKSYSVGNTPNAVKIDIQMNGQSLLKKPIFTIPGIEISSHTKNALYKNIAIGGKFNCFDRYESKDYIKDNLYKVLDLNYIISLCTVIEGCYMYIDQDTSFLYDVQNSYYGIEYTIDDFLSILNLKFLTQRNINIPNNIKYMICESALSVTHHQIGNTLYDRYLKEHNDIYKKVSKNKNNLTNKTKAIIYNSTFLDTFSDLEIEENTNAEKFFLIENEFEKAKDILKLDRFINKDIKLIFNKLGNLKETGIFFKEQGCLYIDIDNPVSFMHEIAHIVDSKMNPYKNASMNSDFRVLAIKYIRELERNSEMLEGEQLSEYTKNRINYHTPTEIFARAFELYLLKIKGLRTNFITNEANMTVENGYPIVTDELSNRIESYFSNMFTFDSNINITNEDTNNSIIISNVDNQNISNETEDLSNQDDSSIEDESITIIEGENGQNFIFKIVQDARESAPRTRYASRRRRLNRSTVNEESLASQITFF